MKKAVAKVVLLGDINVGRTTLINKFCTGNAGNASATIGTDFKQKQLQVQNTNLTMQIWDTAGQEKHVSIGFAFYRGSNCCILTFDVCNQESFDRLAFWKKNFLDLAQPPNKEFFPFVVCGNKTDGQRVVTAEAAKSWCRQNGGYDYYETCATSGDGVQALFTMTGSKALTAIEDEDDAPMPVSLAAAEGAIKLDRETEKAAEESQKKKKKKCKC